MNARAKVFKRRQLKFVIATAKVWEHRQPKFVNATAKVWHAATEAEKFHTFSLPRCCCYPEGLYLTLNKDFDSILLIYHAACASRLSLPRCRFHIVAQEPSDKILTHSQSRSMHRKRTYIISRLLEVKKESVKIFNFTWVWNTAEGEQDRTCKSEWTWADRRWNTLLGIKSLRQCLAASRDKQF